MYNYKIPKYKILNYYVLIPSIMMFSISILGAYLKYIKKNRFLKLYKSKNKK